MIAEATLQLTVNGRQRDVTTDPERPLLDVLREDLSLCGSKYGCGQAQCGACSVLLDGRRAFSCRTPVSAAAGKKITTIEGLETDGKLHPVQQAFLDEGALQCGFCVPGMIIAAAGLLSEKPKPTDDEIIAAMNRNICRCCNYPNILAAVRRAIHLSATHEAAAE